MKQRTLVLACLLAIIGITGCEKEIFNKVPLADAGNSRILQTSKDTIVLRGHGSDPDGNVVGYLWSKVSGPNNPSIDNNGSDSAVVSGLVKGKYIFQFMVIDNSGATAVDTVSITIQSSPVVNLTLQPAANVNEIHILGNSSGSIEGSIQAEEMGGAYWTMNGVEFGMRAALKFDLSSIPANATITSAKLTLYSHPNPLNGDHVKPNSGENNALLIQKVTSAWNFSTVKWLNQPSSSTVQQVVVPHTSLAISDVEADVKELVKSMITTSNYGFLVKLQTETLYTSRIFCTSRYPTASKHPKLEITYQ